MPTNPLILVVGEEAPLATVLRSNLEKRGFRVEEEADGKKALASIAKTKPDLVILDWMLPRMSGIEICRRIRRRAGYSVLIIITGVRSGDDNLVEALNVGADAYIYEAVQHGHGPSTRGGFAPSRQYAVARATNRFS